MSINPEIIMSNDIRGEFSTNLFPENAFEIGHKFAEHSSDTKILIASDLRPSSEILAKNLINGIISAGKTPIFLGPTPISMLYHACLSENSIFKSSIMITASHNAFSQNGFKFILNQEFPSKATLKKIFLSSFCKKITEFQDLKICQTTLNQIKNSYIDSLEIHNFSNLKIAIDALNSVAGEFFSSLNQPNIKIFNQQRISSLTHKPDPKITENIQKFSKFMQEGDFDLGFAFDGDADRVVFFSGQGQKISSDHLTLILANEILENSPKSSQIIIDLKTTNLMEDLAKNHQATLSHCKSGHAHIKKMMKEKNAIYASEASSHYYFRRENSLPFDDAIFAASLICKIFKSKRTLTQNLPKIISTRELRLKGQISNEHLTKIAQDSINKDYKITKIDGVRANFSKNSQEGWFLIRNSGTENVFSVKISANNAKNFSKIKEDFLQITKGIINYEEICLENQ